MTTLGEGGVITVKSDADAALVPGVRHNGVRAYPPGRPRYWVPAMVEVDQDMEGVWPNNFCLGEAQCALGSVLLKRLDRINETLRAQAAKLLQRLADIKELTFQKIPQGYYHVYHVFGGKFDGSRVGKTREDFLDIMTAEYGVRMVVQYYPLYRYPLFQKMGCEAADCPNLEAYWDHSFSFPWWCGIPDETIDYMADCAHKAIAKMRKG
jgi:dTDP-4-amino-4,6-dideoxygalactose transaminase